MQHIKKTPVPPMEWETWFTKSSGERSYDYKRNYGDMRLVPEARKFLLNEQSGLCAYCQSEINFDNSSIEHIIPKSEAPELSTNYHNLVVVCKSPIVTKEGSHCDKERNNEILPPIIQFKSSSTNWEQKNAFFEVKATGEILPCHPTSNRNIQSTAFINVLNLNHPFLVEKRKHRISQLTSVFNKLGGDKNILISEFKRIIESPNEPFREFLLIFLSQKVPRTGR